MGADYAKFIHSVTCRTEDVAVLDCWRALSQHSEQSPYRKSSFRGHLTRLYSPELRERAPTPLGRENGRSLSGDGAERPATRPTRLGSILRPRRLPARSRKARP